MSESDYDGILPTIESSSYRYQNKTRLVTSSNDFKVQHTFMNHCKDVKRAVDVRKVTESTPVLICFIVQQKSITQFVVGIESSEVLLEHVPGILKKRKKLQILANIV